MLDVALLSHAIVEHRADEEMAQIRATVQEKKRLTRLDKKIREIQKIYQQEYKKAASDPLGPKEGPFRKARLGTRAEKATVPRAINALKELGFTEFRHGKGTGTGFPGLKGGPTSFDLIALSPEMEIGVDFQTSSYGGNRKTVQLQNQQRWAHERHAQTGKRTAVYNVTLEGNKYWSRTMSSRNTAKIRQAERMRRIRFRFR